MGRRDRLHHGLASVFCLMSTRLDTLRLYGELCFTQHNCTLLTVILPSVFCLTFVSLDGLLWYTKALTSAFFDRCNLISFIAPFAIQPFTMLSILLCNAAVFSGIALLIQHQGAQVMTAADAVSPTRISNQAEMYSSVPHL